MEITKIYHRFLKAKPLFRIVTTLPLFGASNAVAVEVSVVLADRDFSATMCKLLTRNI